LDFIVLIVMVPLPDRPPGRPRRSPLRGSHRGRPHASPRFDHHDHTHFIGQTHLDSRRGRSVLELLREISHDRGMAVLLATHDPQAAEIADRALLLRDGTLHAHRPDERQGPPASTQQFAIPERDG
jgi:hypothetical protein